MALIRKNASSALLAANRANSRKSTGPQSELGKRHSSQNAGKHLIYAKVSSSSMKELGENPADFYKLRDSLHRALAPRDGFEQMLVEDMAELRWRRRRLLRAEAGIAASKRRKFELDHKWGLASKGKEAGTGSEWEMVGQVGFSGLPDTPRKYSQILSSLKFLRERFQKVGFEEEMPGLLDTVYGKTPGGAGVMLKANLTYFQKHPEAGDDALTKTNRELFVMQLDLEIEFFERLARLIRERDERLTEPMKDAQLLPRRKDLEKIMRYEAALERQFERKLQQLVSWRREKREGGEKEAPQGPAGGQDDGAAIRGGLILHRALRR